jgi:hypothetical protein
VSCASTGRGLCLLRVRPSGRRPNLGRHHQRRDGEREADFVLYLVRQGVGWRVWASFCRASGARQLLGCVSSMVRT